MNNKDTAISFLRLASCGDVHEAFTSSIQCRLRKEHEQSAATWF